MKFEDSGFALLNLFSSISANKPIGFAFAHSDWSASGYDLPGDSTYTELGSVLPFTVGYSNTDILTVNKESGTISINRQAAYAAIVLVQIGGTKGEGNCVADAQFAGASSGRVAFGKTGETGGFNLSLVGMGTVGYTNDNGDSSTEITVRMSGNNFSGTKAQYFSVAVILVP